MKVGRPPIPPHRIKHGTRQGYDWHMKQRKTDPEHETCARCKEYHRVKYRELRARRRRERTRLIAILTKGQERARAAGQMKDVKDIQRLVERYATPEEKKELYSVHDPSE